MIEIIVYRDSGQRYRGYTVKGHAGFAEEGQDVVCAAVSILTQNTANSIEHFTQDSISGEAAEDGGFMKVTFPDGLSKESKLLMDSMIFGLQELAEIYGKRYIKFRFKEV